MIAPPPETAVPSETSSSGNGASSPSTAVDMPRPRDVPVPPTPVSSASAAESALVTPSARPPAAASPSVRRLAREIGVNIAEVEGSGPGGRVHADDVKHHARRFMTDTAGMADLVLGQKAIDDDLEKLMTEALTAYGDEFKDTI